MPDEQLLHPSGPGDRGVFALRLGELALGGLHLLLELLDLLHQLRDGGDIDDRKLRVCGTDAAETQARKDQKADQISGTT